MFFQLMLKIIGFFLYSGTSMAMANMNLIGVFVTKLWPVQALADGGGNGGGTKNIISPKFEISGTIIRSWSEEGSHSVFSMIFML